MGFQLQFDAPMAENFSFMKRMAIKGLKHKGVYDDPQNDGFVPLPGSN